MPREQMANQNARAGMAAALGQFLLSTVARHPAGVIAGFLALIVVGYASINALALQDGEHPSAFFATRGDDGERTMRNGSGPLDEADPVTRIVFDDGGERRFERSRETAAVEDVAPPIPAERIATPAAAGADQPMIELQTMLAELGFYSGEVDGLTGPMTRQAIDEYKVSVGLRGIELTTDELLTSLRNNTMVTAAIPTPRPRVEQEVAANAPSTPAVPALEPLPPDRVVLKVQAGLRAFGNTAIEVDGVAGDGTRAAIREFQALFRMPVTGEIDDALVDKMVTIGLID